MSDQDTTAPGKMTMTIKRVEVAADDPDRFVHGFEKYIYPSWDGWALCLADCIADAALEEMRVRAAARRVRRDDADRLVEEFRRLRERMAGE